MPGLPGLLSNITVGDKRLVSLDQDEAGAVLEKAWEARVSFSPAAF